ncbi:uncharacterized protein LOC129717448 [Wyeomyia smithii]|uniref:uncharacterized protein LOC129717448 n=1 Tax=Wyeomyia smithii TaxID=174621 RepID=UPI002467C2EF|nr:uncharacterized protein LOC129717448 [Wyeomyia smithii]
MSTIVLNELITRFHDIGFSVVACVHDCGGSNLSLWKKIGISYSAERTVMKHPVTSKNIYFFRDARHLLKLIRNWILEKGFFYKDRLVTKKFLLQLVEKASTLKSPYSNTSPEFKNQEHNSLFKLSIKHATVSGAERQNVRLAAELLSHTTAVNLRRHFGEYEEAQLLAEIIDKVNSWFDVLNSHQINQSISSKKCYRMDIERQDKILDDMADLMKNIRTLSNHKLPAPHIYRCFKKQFWFR